MSNQHIFTDPANVQNFHVANALEEALKNIGAYQDVHICIALDRLRPIGYRAAKKLIEDSMNDGLGPRVGSLATWVSTRGHADAAFLNSPEGNEVMREYRIRWLKHLIQELRQDPFGYNR